MVEERTQLPDTVLGDINPVPTQHEHYETMNKTLSAIHAQYPAITRLHRLLIFIVMKLNVQKRILKHFLILANFSQSVK